MLLVIVLTGIINTMLMSVFERVREIGTLLAVGVRRRQVMSVFLLEAGVIGLVGGAGGAAVGSGASSRSLAHSRHSASSCRASARSACCGPMVTGPSCVGAVAVVAVVAAPSPPLLAGVACLANEPRRCLAQR